jgi:dCMP deaminase
MKTVSTLDKWDGRYMDLALHVAGWSKDPNTKVGSVIVTQDNKVLSLGYNGFPRGVADTDERLNNRDIKLQFVAHAERNAMDNVDAALKGCTLYCTLQPCVECAKSIIQRDITKVVCNVNLARKEYYDNFVNYSVKMMEEAGIEVVIIPN